MMLQALHRIVSSILSVSTFMYNVIEIRYLSLLPLKSYDNDKLWVILFLFLVFNVRQFISYLARDLRL